MGHNVYANNMLITAKCADGKSIAAFPDVCMTPPPPPGVPVPYPNTSFASDLTDGSKTVKIGGAEIALKDKSNFKTSIGDEGGCAPKHGVVTGKIKGKTFFTSWSMNVKVEGLNVTRHLDLTTHNHGSQPGNTPPWPHLDKMTAPAADTKKPKTLRATLLEVSFDSDVPKVYRYAAKNEVKAPHWTKGVDMEDGKYSKKPAVYKINGKRDMKVKIRIDESTFGGNGTLRGKFGDLEIEGSIELGEQPGKEFTVQIKKLPENLTWLRGTARWEIVADAETTVPLESTFLEVFVIFDKPGKMFDEKGVWADALRWLFKRVKVGEINKPEEAAKKITSFCFGKRGQGLRYDTVAGASWYNANPIRSDSFHLFGYMRKSITVPGHTHLIKPGAPECNCYDQAAAIQSLCGAIGMVLIARYMDPFGYIKPILLVGVGRCNNPFSWDDPQGNAVIGADEGRRQGFGNHAFCSYNDKIHDACGGPALGKDNLDGYTKNTIDKKTILYHKNYWTWGTKAPAQTGVVLLELDEGGHL
jgi:uncharacterized Zn-binding protein involved in type VI secretion